MGSLKGKETKNIVTEIASWEHVMNKLNYPQCEIDLFYYIQLWPHMSCICTRSASQSPLLCTAAPALRCAFMAAVGCDSSMGQHIGLVADTWKNRYQVAFMSCSKDSKG
jgi:hypothetical protein